MDIYPEHKKEYDAFIDMVSQYAQKHGFAYLISIGKYHEDVDKTIVMDDFKEHPFCGLDALTKMLVQPGRIAISIVGSIMEAGYEASTTQGKSKH